MSKQLQIIAAELEIQASDDGPDEPVFFVAESDATETKTAVRDGEIVPWRRDEQNNQWYRRIAR